MRGDGQGSGRRGAEALRGGVVLRLADQSQLFGANGEPDGLDDAGGLCKSVSGFGNECCALRAGIRRGPALPKVPRFCRSGMFLLARPQVRGRDLTKNQTWLVTSHENQSKYDTCLK